MSDVDLDELAEDLAELGPPEKKGGRPAREERIIAGFEEIQRFVDERKRLPVNQEGCDVFERLYAVRLSRLRAQADCRAVLSSIDRQKLLDGLEVESPGEIPTIGELAAELGDVPEAESITTLRHVRPAAERRAAEEVANRTRCQDFEDFKPLFDEIQQALAEKKRTTRRYTGKLEELAQGRFYILEGQKLFIAKMHKPFLNEQGKRDARLRVIFDNGTESNLLMRSLQKALQQDPSGRIFDDSVLGPLFVTQPLEESGNIYVLRTKSTIPALAAHRDVLHKIGVTGGSVAERVANAKSQTTFLLSDVEIVQTYTLYGINRMRLESLIHRVFGAVRFDIEIKDAFGNAAHPEEWFLVPFPVIDEVMKRIEDGSITSFVYDPATARLSRVGESEPINPLPGCA